MVGMGKLNRTHAIIIAAVAAVCVVVGAVAVGSAQSGGDGGTPSESSEEQHEMGLQDCLDLGNQRLMDLDFEGAVLAFKNAIQIDPHSQDAITGLTTAYYQWAGSETRNGNYSHALEILGNASADLPNDLQFTQLVEAVSLSSTLHGATDQYASGFSDEFTNNLISMNYDADSLPTTNIYNALAETSDQSGNTYSADLFGLCNNNGGKYVLEPYGIGIYKWLSSCDLHNVTGSPRLSVRVIRICDIILCNIHIHDLRKVIDQLFSLIPEFIGLCSGKLDDINLLV